MFQRFCLVNMAKLKQLKEKPMRRYRLLAMICIALFSLCAYASLAQEAGGPKMILKERLFDFGEVKEGKIIRHTFEVLNQGDEILNIEKVTPG